jgi:hypothetical protein
LHEHLWDAAKSPILFGFTYDSTNPTLALSLAKHEELSVLVAMSDACEATTTITPGGKSVTKMMFIVRNNLKQYMTMKMPEGAQVWSTFVNDRPVAPLRNRKGEVLIPLVKSEAVDPEDADDVDERGEPKSYAAKRDKRRAENPNAPMVQKVMRDRMKRMRAAEVADGPADLKPYDVEIVFVTPPVKLAEKGTIRAALPEVDVPCGQVAWAVFLPKGYQLLDAEGNVKEVASFSLPFRHFADAEYARQHEVRQQQQQAMQELAKASDAIKNAQEQLAASAKVAGVLPVRIEIPIAGEIYRFEKFLAVEEGAAVTMTYRKKVQ